MGFKLLRNERDRSGQGERGEVERAGWISSYARAISPCLPQLQRLLRMRTFLILVGVTNIVLFLLARDDGFPIKEDKAIRAVVERYATMTGRTVWKVYSGCEIRAERDGERGWQVFISDVINARPGGLRHTVRFRVSDDFETKYVDECFGGTY
jgi:hypothetical protein